MEELFVTENLNIGKILEELWAVGTTSVRILDEDFRISLLEEAHHYSYEPEEEVVGSGERLVKQQVLSFKDFPDESDYILLKDSFEELFNRHLEGVEPYPFETPLNFNSMVLQKYEKESIGITPHKDGKNYINVVCIFIIGGKGRFFICSDRAGNDSREIDGSEGNLILMRAPGFYGSENDRPFHYVMDIKEGRYSFGVRQKRV
jgi:hypothetical protein